MEDLYLITGKIIVWGLISIAIIILWLIFWYWNNKNYTVLYSLWDFALCMLKYPSLGYEEKKFLYDYWKKPGKVKARWLYNIIMRKLEKDLNA